MERRDLLFLISSVPIINHICFLSHGMNFNIFDLILPRIPDNANVRERMLYASSVDALKSQLTGFKCYLQLNEKADLTEEHFLQSLPGSRN